ncbi:MAG: coenzyme F420-0:L-glutamate ligase [Chloroflexi bacterium]|nr:coenzyme F420-0:L-glutamate ligase [Chloroflexota bacterium]
MPSITLFAIPGIPLVRSGDDLAQLICQALAEQDMALEDNDVLVVAQKVVSKAEGRTVRMADVDPSPRAREVAEATGKDPRLVEVILRESREVLWAAGGLLIVEQQLGLVCANAGVDRSNAGAMEEDVVCLLPVNPDASAQHLRRRLSELASKDVAVIINDTQGRAFRDGAIGLAIGVAGMAAMADHRGQVDLFGYRLQTSVEAVADEVASAASLLMGQSNEALPAVLVRGLPFQHSLGSAAELIRPKERDIFRNTL